jgi:hypothetical protein
VIFERCLQRHATGLSGGGQSWRHLHVYDAQRQFLPGRSTQFQGSVVAIVQQKHHIVRLAALLLQRAKTGHDVRLLIIDGYRYGHALVLRHELDLLLRFYWCKMKLQYECDPMGHRFNISFKKQFPV